MKIVRKLARGLVFVLDDILMKISFGMFGICPSCFTVGRALGPTYMLLFHTCGNIRYTYCWQCNQEFVECGELNRFPCPDFEKVRTMMIAKKAKERTDEARN